MFFLPDLRRFRLSRTPCAQPFRRSSRSRSKKAIRLQTAAETRKVKAKAAAAAVMIPVTTPADATRTARMNAIPAVLQSVPAGHPDRSQDKFLFIRTRKLTDQTSRIKSGLPAGRPLLFADFLFIPTRFIFPASVPAPPADGLPHVRLQIWRQE